MMLLTLTGAIGLPAKAGAKPPDLPVDDTVDYRPVSLLPRANPLFDARLDEPAEDAVDLGPLALSPLGTEVAWGTEDSAEDSEADVEASAVETLEVMPAEEIAEQADLTRAEEDTEALEFDPAADDCDCPQVKGDASQSSSSDSKFTCPYLKGKKSPEQRADANSSSGTTADDDATVLDNLNRLIKARKIYRKAEKMRRHGDYDAACRMYTEVRTVCPGSRYAAQADKRLAEVGEIRAAEATRREAATQTESEESEAVPMERLHKKKAPMPGDAGAATGCPSPCSGSCCEAGKSCCSKCDTTCCADAPKCGCAKGECCCAGGKGCQSKCCGSGKCCDGKCCSRACCQPAKASSIVDQCAACAAACAACAETCQACTGCGEACKACTACAEACRRCAEACKGCAECQPAVTGKDVPSTTESSADEESEPQSKSSCTESGCPNNCMNPHDPHRYPRVIVCPYTGRSYPADDDESTPPVSPGQEKQKSKDGYPSVSEEEASDDSEAASSEYPGCEDAAEMNVPPGVDPEVVRFIDNVLKDLEKKGTDSAAEEQVPPAPDDNDSPDIGAEGAALSIFNAVLRQACGAAQGCEIGADFAHRDRGRTYYRVQVGGVACTLVWDSTGKGCLVVSLDEPNAVTSAAAE
jgi:hypothetical protein